MMCHFLKNKQKMSLLPAKRSAPSEEAPEWRFDPLMSHMWRELQGTDYSSKALNHSKRLRRMDEVLNGLKAQGVVKEPTLIDRPLQRAAFNALIDPLYRQHREAQQPVVGRNVGRHGVVPSDLYFHALHQHMLREGFTPEASASFDNKSEQALNAHNDYQLTMRNRYLSEPDPEVVAQQQELRHMYTGDPVFGRY